MQQKMVQQSHRRKNKHKNRNECQILVKLLPIPKIGGSTWLRKMKLELVKCDAIRAQLDIVRFSLETHHQLQNGYLADYHQNGLVDQENAESLVDPKKDPENVGRDKNQESKRR